MGQCGYQSHADVKYCTLLWENNLAISRKPNTCVSYYDPAIPLLGLYPIKCEHTCLPKKIATLVMTTLHQQRPSCALVVEWAGPM